MDAGAATSSKVRKAAIIEKPRILHITRIGIEEGMGKGEATAPDDDIPNGL